MATFHTFKRRVARLIHPRDAKADRVVLGCFRAGMDTKHIADLIGEPESRIACMLAQAREDEHAFS